MASPPNVTHNAAASRFEIHTEAGLAVLEYRPRGDALDLVHTLVPPDAEGKGYGMALAEAALKYARAQQKAVVPSCPFVRTFIRRHPKFADLVAGG